MYENYSRQSLPIKEYRELLGTALCVFNSNVAFLIENILRIEGNQYSWYKLIDMEAGNLKPIVRDTITKACDRNIESIFADLVDRRNRIIHSFQITSENNKQILATKDRKSGEQFVITVEYLMNFIKDNEKLSDMLHKFRGY